MWLNISSAPHYRRAGGVIIHGTGATNRPFRGSGPQTLKGRLLVLSLSLSLLPCRAGRPPHCVEYLLGTNRPSLCVMSVDGSIRDDLEISDVLVSKVVGFSRSS